MARQDWRSGLWRLLGAMGFMCFGRISETQIWTELEKETNSVRI